MDVIFLVLPKFEFLHSVPTFREKFNRSNSHSINSVELLCVVLYFINIVFCLSPKLLLTSDIRLSLIQKSGLELSLFLTALAL